MNISYSDKYFDISQQGLRSEIVSACIISNGILTPKNQYIEENL